MKEASDFMKEWMRWYGDSFRHIYKHHMQSNEREMSDFLKERMKIYDKHHIIYRISIPMLADVWFF